MLCTDTNVTVEADFVVIDGDAGPYYAETVEKLNLLHVGPIHSVNNVGVETTDQDIQGKYKELFDRVGLLKGYELKLNVDTFVKPDAQTGGKVRVVGLWDHRRSTRGTNQLGLFTCCCTQT